MALLDTETQVSVLIGGFTGGLDHPECISWGCDGFRVCRWRTGADIPDQRRAERI